MSLIARKFLRPLLLNFSAGLRLRSMVPLLTALLALCSAPAVLAHGGEDHSHDEPAAALASATGERPQRLADGSLYIPKVAQRQWQLRTALLKSAEHVRTLELPGTVIPDPAYAGLIEASQLGQLQAGPQGWPTLGQHVKAGELLAYIAPLDTSLDRSNQQALLAELDSQIALSRDRIRRFEQLGNLMPASELTAQRIELKGLQQRRQSAAQGTGQWLPVLAPVSGVVSRIDKLNGQVVDSKDSLFQLIDPARLLIEVRVWQPELTPEAGSRATAALLQAPSHHYQLELAGKGLQLTQQAQPLWYRLAQTQTQAQHPALLAGQAMTVQLPTAERLQGIALPRESLLKDAQGNEMVWLKTAPETFVARPVQSQPLNAAEVLVQGLSAGDRVVVQAASLLAQLR